MRNYKETLVNFYKGTDGPTIIINIQDVEWLKWFRDIIIKLQKSEIQTIELLENKLIKGDGISKLTISKGNCHSLSLIKKTKAFVWVLDDEKTIDIIECCDNLINKDTAGHYYFHDDKPAIIEFSYKE